MPDIFISYCRIDEESTKELANDIAAIGHQIWFDRAITGGQSWWEKILLNIRNCEIFVFILSPDSLNSIACQREYMYASELGKPILPVLVNSVSVNLLPPELSKINFVDYQNPNRVAGLRLANALSNTQPRKRLPKELPPPPEAPISYIGSLAQQVNNERSLNFQEQSALFIELKNGLRSEDTVEDSYVLLKKLRQRPDLFATIAEGVDELFITNVGSSNFLSRKKTSRPFVRSHEKSSQYVGNNSASWKKLLFYSFVLSVVVFFLMSSLLNFGLADLGYSLLFPVKVGDMVFDVVMLLCAIAAFMVIPVSKLCALSLRYQFICMLLGYLLYVTYGFIDANSIGEAEHSSQVLKLHFYHAFYVGIPTGYILGAIYGCFKYSQPSQD